MVFICSLFLSRRCSVSQIFGVFAIGPNGEFGSDTSSNGLPWSSKRDMRWFRTLTLQQSVLISKKTLDKIKGGLPNRRVFTTTRQGVFSPANKPVDINYMRDDVYIIGGSKVIENYKHLMEFIFVSVIDSSELNNEANGIRLTIDSFLNDFDVIFAGQTKQDGLNDAPVTLYVLKRKHYKESVLPNRLKDLIINTFEPYIKLTAKKNYHLQSESHGTVDVNEQVYTPKNQIGIFDVRKKHGDKGLYTTGVTFKREWSGKPTITLTNKELVGIDINRGEEVGEISFVNNKSI